MLFNLDLFVAVQSPNMFVSTAEMMEKPSANATFELLGDVVHRVQVFGEQVGPRERLVTLRTRQYLSGDDRVLVLIMSQHVSTIRKGFLAYRTHHHFLVLFLRLALLCNSTRLYQQPHH